jgi:hypothetical protein
MGTLGLEKHKINVGAKRRKPMQKRDRFLLEKYIMQCWHITDDLETISNYVADHDIPVEHLDKILNMLIGLQALYNQRFSDTMNLFEELLEQKKIV